MADDYNRDVTDNLARILATIAILLGLLALGWAVKADNHAGEAENRAIQSSETMDNSTIDDTAPSGTGTTDDTNADDTGTGGTDTGTGTGTGTGSADGTTDTGTGLTDQ